VDDKMKLPSVPEYGDQLALEYLNFLVSDQYMPEETALFYLEIARINEKPIHYFITESLVEYFLYLSQEPEEEENADSIH
tara:strand:- start:3216 stop:3455 length:240 start_codon:yes stop_codon:yes gene_type:complete